MPALTFKNNQQNIFLTDFHDFIGTFPKIKINVLRQI